MLPSQEAKVVVTGGLRCDQIQHQGFFQKRLWAAPKSMGLKKKKKVVDFSLDCLGTYSWHSDIDVAKIVLSKSHEAMKVLLFGRSRITYGQADNGTV